MDAPDAEFLSAIEAEFQKIEKKWLRLHFNAAVGVVAFAFVLEIVYFWVFYAIGGLKTTVPIYLIKFIVVPSLFNAFCLLVMHQVSHSSRLSQKAKSWAMSLGYVAICFVIFTIHQRAFSSVFLIFAVPTFLTVVYGDYRLALATTLGSVAASVGSQLFIRWDVEQVFYFYRKINVGNLALSVVGLFAFFAICALIIHFEREKRDAGIQKELELHALQRRVQIDELTGIGNRNGLRTALAAMEEDVGGGEYVLAMADIDNFKRLNDIHGHVVGDRCLAEFGRILAERSGGALPVRYGGDEFCILFRGEPMDRILKTCERIQQDFRAVRMLPEGELKLTVSFGVARYVRGMGQAKLIANTDKALYESKIAKDAITVYFGEPGRVKERV